MGTYRTTLIPGDRGGAETPRLLAVSSLGLPTFLTRACPHGHPSRAALERLTRTQIDRPEIAGLVEIGEDAHGVWVVESAVPCLPLQLVAERASQLNRTMPPLLAAWLAMRVCQLCAALPYPHLRASTRNVFIRPDGQPYLLGAIWARALPACQEDRPFLPSRPVDETRVDAYSAAALACSLAGGLARFTGVIRAALEAAAGVSGPQWMLSSADAARAFEEAMLGTPMGQASATMAAWLRSLELPGPDPFDGASITLTPIGQLDSQFAHDEDPTSDFLASGRVMSIDGRIEGPETAPAGSVPSGALQARFGPHKTEPPLELDWEAHKHAMTPLEDHRAQNIRGERKLARKRSKARLVLAVVAVVAIAGLSGAGVWLVQQTRPDLIGDLDKMPAAVQHKELNKDS